MSRRTIGRGDVQAKLSAQTLRADFLISQSVPQLLTLEGLEAGFWGGTIADSMGPLLVLQQCCASGPVGEPSPAPALSTHHEGCLAVLLPYKGRRLHRA